MTEPRTNQLHTDDARLAPVRGRGDILPAYRGTPIETLLTRHALGEPLDGPPEPELVIVTCMDHRIALDLPDEFAFVIRTAGANAEPVLFNIACALALRPVRTVAVIGHSDCAMVDVERHRAAFLDVIPSLGAVTAPDAEKMFEQGAGDFGCGDAVAHAVRQCAELREVFPDVLVGPLFYDVADGSLAQIVE